MPVLLGRTREQLRVSVGLNCGAVKLITSAAAGSTTTFLTDGLFTGADDWNGSWIQFTGPTNNDGVTGRVKDSSITSDRTTLTVFPAITAPATSDTAELWKNKFDPAIIHEFINQAIMEVMGRVYDPEESLALHADGQTMRFDIPTEFAMLNRIDYRTKVDFTVVHEASSAWDEAAAPSNVTRSVDTEHYKGIGRKANKFVIAGAFTTGLISSKAITSKNISGYDYIELWIESTIATTSGDFTLLLDDTAACVSALETLTIPALVADTPTFVRIALGNPDLDTAIISVGLNAANNIAANTVWIREVRAVKDASASWVALGKHLWRVDEEARDLVLSNGGRLAAGYHALKLVGGDEPVLLSADATASEIDDQYIVARATELTLMACGHGTVQDPGLLNAMIGEWRGRAEAAKRNMPFLTNVRVVG